MNILFDKFNLFEKPTLVLCNPNKDQLFALGDAYNIVIKQRFNALSELTFTVSQRTDSVDSPYWEWIDYRRVIYIDSEFGYYMITGIREKNDGLKNIKDITCQSLDCELLTAKISLFKGTFKFYDIFNPGVSFMGIITTYLNGWTIGYVSPSLIQKYRYFDISDTTIYELLMTEAEKAYECIFKYDTVAKTISVYDVNEATTSSNIYVSFDNLLKETEIDVVTSELTTALNVYGAGDLDISTVNPLGGVTIYNFDYYKNTNWMSAGLISALTAWELAVDAQQVPYANLLTQYKNQNELINTYLGELNSLQADYTALEGVLKARVQARLSTTAIKAQMNAKLVQIRAKQTQISNAEAQKTVIWNQLLAINSSLSFANNFTPAEYAELKTYIIQSTYQNENFIQTTTMSNTDIQDMAQNLYNQSQNILTRISQPRYTFSCDTTNFAFLKEYQTFTTQLELGSVISLELNTSVETGVSTTSRATKITYPVVLEIVLDYENPLNCKFEFSNRLRLDNGSFQFSDLFGQSVNGGTMVNFGSVNWGDWTENYQNFVTNFVDSALDASLNNVINATNQEIVIGANGLQGKQLISGSGFDAVYDPRQVWLMNNTLAFTKDGWANASLALGEVLNPSGSGTNFGLIADVIVGRLIAGNELIIANDKNNFLLDGSGAYLNNASFTLQTNSNKTKILLDPNNGIAVQKNVAGNFVNQFYVDTDGNVIFSGNLQGASGTFSGTLNATIGNIGGWKIEEDGLANNYGDYIYSNGHIRLGALTIDGNKATFAGNIYADNLMGTITGSQIGYGQIGSNHISELTADKITTGTLSADRIYGGTIRWEDVTMGIAAGGQAQIIATDSINLRTPMNYILQSNGYTSIMANNEVTIGVPPEGKITIAGDIYLEGRVFINNVLIA